MPLSLLSYASALGILCTLFLVVVMFIDGLGKADSPGSLWSPAPTSLNPGNLEELGLAFGLFMAGVSACVSCRQSERVQANCFLQFSGHVVIPSLARDMVDPTQFDTMINWAFGIASAIYTTIGVTGYLMFGNSVFDEVREDCVYEFLFAAYFVNSSVKIS